MGDAIVIEAERKMKVNTLERGLSSILTDVHIGDRIELELDKQFFSKEASSEPERYSGYVALIEDEVIGLSVSHPANEFHGLLYGEDRHQTEPGVRYVKVSCIKNYRVF